MPSDITLQVSEAIEMVNGVLGEAFPFILVEGEVASFKVNQNKFVFFDIKDASGSLGCFMMLFNLKFPLEDGMKVKVLAEPKLTNWGKFSLTVRDVLPVGEGSLKKSFELLKAKLEKEGLFEESRKRLLPAIPKRIGVISSSGAAGYADFIKILDNRWGDLEIVLADVPVQGMNAPAEIIGGIQYLNELAEPLDVIAVIRGGGSADDLSAFNHEAVVRAIALSRAPVIVGVGHEVDTSLSDLVADKRAATPSNAAELLVPDKNQILQQAVRAVETAKNGVEAAIKVFEMDGESIKETITAALSTFISKKNDSLVALARTLNQLNPKTVLQRGYSLAYSGGKLLKKVSGVTIGDEVVIELSDGTVGAEVKNVQPEK